MKRGLAIHDQTEVPADEFHGRIDRLREQIRAAGLDGAVVYGDVARSDDIAYLTNLCLYWNEAVILVPVTGEPVLLTKLSPRVHGWIQRNTVLTEIRSTKDLAAAIAGEAEELGLSSLAVVEHDIWCASVVRRLAELAPGVRLEAWDSVVRQHRSVPSTASMDLLRQAGTRLAGALATVNRSPRRTPEDIFSLLDLHTRRGEFMDLFVETDAAPSGGFASRVAGQFRYLWTASARTWPENGNGHHSETIEHAYRSAASALRPGAERAELAAAAKRVLDDSGFDGSWRVDCIDHADLSSFGDVAASAGLAPLPIQTGSVVAVFMEAEHAGGGKSRIGDTYVVTDNGAECLTAVT